MVDRSFGKHERLLKRPEFDSVLAQGKRIRVENLFTVFCFPNGLQHQRLGIIASRKVGNAVVRNRVKRIIREVFRNIKGRISPAMDIVVIAGKGMTSRPYSLLEKKLATTLRVHPQA